jgi:hypothetical protein
MKNKEYYIDLSNRWFDALLTGDEERELKAFLASTDDSDFNEVKAVAGYFATGKALYEGGKKRRTTRRLVLAVAAMAASLAIFAAIGLNNHRLDNCYILANGEKTTDPEKVLESMEATLSTLFGTAPDIEKELETLLK